VVTSWTARGTVAGEMGGVDFDDDEVRASGINIYRISDFTIGETWWQIRPAHTVCYIQMESG
jgi:hypothetical protein